MHINSISLAHYRNYTVRELNFGKLGNLIVAPNGTGKTNLLEALALFLLGKSFRAEREHEVINWEQQRKPEDEVFLPFARVGISGNVENNGGNGENSATGQDFRAACLLRQTAGSTQRVTKEWLYNERKCSQRKVVENMHGLLFTPDSLAIVQGSPEKRRAFFDTLACQLDPAYRVLLSNYERILKRRNHLLRHYREQPECFDASQLALWDEQLLSAGAQLMVARTAATQSVLPLLQTISQHLFSSGQQATCTYAPSLASHLSPEDASASSDRHGDYQAAIAWFQEILSQYRTRELAAGMTLKGPHRDDWNFFLDGVAARTFASRGQQRLIVLSLVQAAITLMEQTVGTMPLVLLDDLFSELDEAHQELLVDFLSQKPYQVFLTSCSEQVTANGWQVLRLS